MDDVEIGQKKSDKNLGSDDKNVDKQKEVQLLKPQVVKVVHETDQSGKNLFSETESFNVPSEQVEVEDVTRYDLDRSGFDLNLNKSSIMKSEVDDEEYGYEVAYHH